MTPDQRLEAIFSRLGKIETDAAMHHARIEGTMARVGDRLEALAEKVKVQNGRVGKLEDRVQSLETRATISERDDHQDDARHDVVAARMWQFISGAGLVALGAVMGYFL